MTIANKIKEAKLNHVIYARKSVLHSYYAVKPKPPGNVRAVFYVLSYGKAQKQEERNMKKQFTAFALVTDGRDIWEVNIFTYDNADEARAVLEKFKSQYENSNISVIKTYIKEDNT